MKAVSVARLGFRTKLCIPTAHKTFECGIQIKSRLWQSSAYREEIARHKLTITYSALGFLVGRAERKSQRSWLNASTPQAYWLRPSRIVPPKMGPPVLNTSQMFMYCPRLAGGGYPKATAPSEAQNSPALIPQATAPTRTNQTFPCSHVQHQTRLHTGRIRAYISVVGIEPSTVDRITYSAQNQSPLETDTICNRAAKKTEKAHQAEDQGIRCVDQERFLSTSSSQRVHRIP